jgi:heme oxygenase
MSLKELTKEVHTAAERQEFVKVLMSGKINPRFYATYLWNQWKKYERLEELLDHHGVWAADDLLFAVRNTQDIKDDCLELWPHTDMVNGQPITLPSTLHYLDHLEEIKTNKQQLLSHLYTLHMGDLSGGQMISRKVPGTGRMYKFRGNVNDLKDNLRKYTTDDMADEARWVFQSSISLFQELMEVDIEHYME